MNHREQQVASRCAQQLVPNAKLEKLLGIQMLDVGPGYAKLSMTVREDMCNFYGSAHGGAVFSLADSAFALACNTSGQVTVASGCSIEFLRPCAQGDVLTAVCRMRGGAGKSGVYYTEIFNSDDELVACFTGRAHRTSAPINVE